jgi:hypothetical protein
MIHGGIFPQNLAAAVRFPHRLTTGLFQFVTACQLNRWSAQYGNEYRGTVEVEATRNVVTDGKTRIERFEDNYQRPTLLRDWQRQREQWVKNETPARQTLALFQTVYEWYGILEREGEKIELMVGDGLLCCPATNPDPTILLLLVRARFEHPLPTLRPALRSELFLVDVFPMCGWRDRSSQRLDIFLCPVGWAWCRHSLQNGATAPS